jgi:hypothetical protein
MTVHTPCIPIFFHKRRAAIKRITTLCAEEMASMPLRTTSNDNLALDRCLARLAARGEELVEIKMAVKPPRFIGAVIMFQTRHIFSRGVRGEERDVVTRKAGVDALYAFGVFFSGFGVEGYAFEVLAALEAGEAFGVEAGACC